MSTICGVAGGSSIYNRSIRDFNTCHATDDKRVPQLTDDLDSPTRSLARNCLFEWFLFALHIHLASAYTFTSVCGSAISIGHYTDTHTHNRSNEDRARLKLRLELQNQHQVDDVIEAAAAASLFRSSAGKQVGQLCPSSRTWQKLVARSEIPLAISHLNLLFHAHDSMKLLLY